MKFLKFFLFTAAILTVVSCSSDDDGGPAPVELNESTVAATYEVVFYEGSEIESVTTGSGNTSVVETITFTTDTFTDARFTFLASGTFSSSGSFRITEVTSTPGGDSDTDIYITFFDDDDEDFSVNTEERTITVDDEVWEVTRFDDDELFLTLDYTEIEGNSSFEISEEIRLVRVE